MQIITAWCGFGGWCVCLEMISTAVGASFFGGVVVAWRSMLFGRGVVVGSFGCVAFRLGVRLFCARVSVWSFLRLVAPFSSWRFHICFDAFCVFVRGGGVDLFGAFHLVSDGC